MHPSTDSYKVNKPNHPCFSSSVAAGPWTEQGLASRALLLENVDRFTKNVSSRERITILGKATDERVAVLLCKMISLFFREGWRVEWDVLQGFYL